jgi:hypothetical protein
MPDDPDRSSTSHIPSEDDDQQEAVGASHQLPQPQIDLDPLKQIKKLPIMATLAPSA